MTTRMAITARSFFLRLALTTALVFMFVVGSRAGGPKCVAGTSYFDGTTTGQPLVWPQGTVTYYTDQGDLSRDSAQCVGQQLCRGSVRAVDRGSDGGSEYHERQARWLKM